MLFAAYSLAAFVRNYLTTRSTQRQQNTAVASIMVPLVTSILTLSAASQSESVDVEMNKVSDSDDKSDVSGADDGSHSEDVGAEDMQTNSFDANGTNSGGQERKLASKEEGDDGNFSAANAGNLAQFKI